MAWGTGRGRARRHSATPSAAAVRPPRVVAHAAPGLRRAWVRAQASHIPSQGPANPRRRARCGAPRTWTVPPPRRGVLLRAAAEPPQAVTGASRRRPLLPRWNPGTAASSSPTAASTRSCRPRCRFHFRSHRRLRRRPRPGGTRRPPQAARQPRRRPRPGAPCRPLSRCRAGPRPPGAPTAWPPTAPVAHRAAAPRLSARRGPEAPGTARRRRRFNSSSSGSSSGSSRRCRRLHRRPARGPFP